MEAIKETITAVAQLYQRTQSRGAIPRSQGWNHPWFQEVKDLQQNSSLKLRRDNFSSGPIFNRTSQYKGTSVVGTHTRHGTGIETWKDGTRYQGGFKHDDRHAYGIYKFDGESHYVGDFGRGV